MNAAIRRATFLAIAPVVLLAQNALVNVKGTVLDERTGKPLGHEMDMVITSEKTGKKFVVKVNSATGEYLQPLESGQRYSIVFSSYAIYRKHASIEIPPMQKFKELTFNFTVRSLQEGEPLAEIRAFAAGSSVLSAEARGAIERVLDLLKENRQMRIVVELAREREPAPPPPVQPRKSAPKKSTKGKKASAEPLPPPPVPQPPAVNEQLYAARLEVLKQMFADIRDAEVRVQYRAGPEQDATSAAPNLRILTGPVKSIFDE
ncbi:MAG: hypothetical protein KatS3mg040_0106 [Candidatus Kapaibacterium sp.]|nr:MAG: hypothetical protein KatS3mg040_0106 [Candidatus Kapabacteria bacterium]